MSISYEMSQNCKQRFAYILYYFHQTILSPCRTVVYSRSCTSWLNSVFAATVLNPREQAIVRGSVTWSHTCTFTVYCYQSRLKWGDCCCSDKGASPCFSLPWHPYCVRSLGRLSKVLTGKMLKILYQKCKKSSWLRVDAKVYLWVVQQPSISAYNYVLKFSFIITQAVIFAN